MIAIQEMLNIVVLFTSQSTINFYQSLFNNVDLSLVPKLMPSKRGSKGYSRHALIRVFIVMNYEHFRQISSLLDFLNSNLKIAQLCGFNIMHRLPSYRAF